MNFEKVLDEAINSTMVEDIKNYGYCHFSESYTNEAGQVVKIEVYELDCKTFLIRYLDEKCVLFRDITALKK